MVDRFKSNKSNESDVSLMSIWNVLCCSLGTKKLLTRSLCNRGIVSGVGIYFSNTMLVNLIRKQNLITIKGAELTRLGVLSSHSGQITFIMLKT